MASSDTLEAKESFVCNVDGEDLLVRQGDLFAADHPAVKKFKQRFKPHEIVRIEQATAAPGEKRGA